MKSIFKSYLIKDVSEVEDIWKKAIISVDTNVLLNLYRYSELAQHEVLDVFEKIKSKLFLTHHVGLEFHRNRYNVFSDQEEIYKKYISQFRNIRKELTDTNIHPHLSQSIEEELINVLDKVEEDLTSSLNKYNRISGDDMIYNKVSQLFQGRIGKGYELNQLEIIIKEGADRYRRKVPPGFKDDNTKENDNKYGDFIIWKQLIDLAKEHNSPIIFITDEKKEDWWWKTKNGKVISPRPELVEEMFSIAGVDFLMYSLNSFLKNPMILTKVSPNTISEINKYSKYFEKVKEYGELNLVKENGELNSEEILDLIHRFNSKKELYLRKMSYIKDINSRDYKSVYWKFLQNESKLSKYRQLLFNKFNHSEFEEDLTKDIN